MRSLGLMEARVMGSNKPTCRPGQAGSMQDGGKVCVPQCMQDGGKACVPECMHVYVLACVVQDHSRPSSWIHHFLAWQHAGHACHLHEWELYATPCHPMRAHPGKTFLAAAAAEPLSHNHLMRAVVHDSGIFVQKFCTAVRSCNVQRSPPWSGAPAVLPSHRCDHWG